jgi:hypothetical protein
MPAAKTDKKQKPKAAFFKREKKVRKGVAKPAATKKKEAWFQKRAKTAPKAPKEIAYEVTYNVLKNMRGT